MDFKEAIHEYAEVPLPLQVIKNLLKGYKRPYDKINVLVKKEELIPIKKGLYIPGHKLHIPKPLSFLIANHIWGPSYVSLEKALSYWGFIPERVYDISSITVKTSKTYNTPIGRFRYSQAPLPYYAFGIKSVVLTQKQVALVASPEKAICDKIVMTSGIFLRSTKQAQEFLIDDLRMEKDMLQKLNAKEINSWIDDAPKKSSLQVLVKTLNNL
jgi:predicted transcriptional regulator of viral defense system